MSDSASSPRPETAEDIADVIRSRRSINLFEPQAPGTADLLDAIELARWAPNHGLTEPWRFYLIGERTAAEIVDFAVEFETAAKGEKAGLARRKRLEGIPAFFVATCRKSDKALLQQEDYAACCCAVQNLMLYLWHRGIGVKWTTGAVTREQRFYDVVGIDSEAEMIVGFFWYGRPKVVPVQKRREVAEVVVDTP
ncbi:MAG: nitroreductase [Gammaproteobacteria bacterium]|nr:nitroreductase [Gammaproteobacteria bacterium]